MLERRFTTAPGAAPVMQRATKSGVGTATGYASVFWDGTPGTQYFIAGYHERIDRNAFARALREKHDTVALFDHRKDVLLGRVSSGTLQLSVDKRGLKYQIRLPDTTGGRDVAELIRRGDVRGSSFAFTPLKSEWKDEQRTAVRIITDLYLHDVSAVVHPAYQAADVSLDARADALRRRLQAISDRADEVWSTFVREGKETMKSRPTDPAAERRLAEIAFRAWEVQDDHDEPLPTWVLRFDDLHDKYVRIRRADADAHMSYAARYHGGVTHRGEMHIESR
jgi:uncharacterized protein